MNMKKLIGMAVVLILLAGIAIFQQKNDAKRRAVPAENTTLLQDIDLNAITAVEITQNSNHVSLVKKDGQWVVSTLYNYPVDFSRLADALRDMAAIKTGTPVRSGNVKASEFGLDDQAKTIALKTGDEKTVATVTVGARREASASAGWANQFFVSKDGGDAVYLVDYDFHPFSELSSDWIDKELLKVPSDSIVSARSGDVEMKLDGAEWMLSGLNKQTEELQTSEAGRLRSTLQYFSCAGVADPAKTDDQLGFDHPSTYVAQTKDGFTYTVTLGSKTGENRYARLHVAYIRPEPPAVPQGDDEEKKKAYSKQLDEFNNTTAANADKADRLNKKFADWTYLISNYSADGLLMPRNELVKIKTDEQKDKPAS